MVDNMPFSFVLYSTKDIFFDLRHGNQFLSCADAYSDCSLRAQWLKSN